MMTDNISVNKNENITDIQRIQETLIQGQQLQNQDSRLNTETTGKPQKENMFINILMNVVIPTLILIKLSGDEYLGAKWALIIALAFPIGYGIKDFLTHRKFNFFSALGIVSVLLTGGISLLHLDAKYYAIKEAAIPSLIGLVFIISTKTRYPLVKTLIYNDNILKVDKISAHLKERDNEEQFEKVLRNGSYLQASSFFVCAVLNYVLAKLIVVSESGTAAFNVEIGRMHMVGFAVITIPSILFLVATLFYIFREIRLLTGLSFEDVMQEENNDKK